jgi:pimeloyl-ACP methyl ester carboxylesterase
MTNSRRQRRVLAALLATVPLALGACQGISLDALDDGVTLAAGSVAGAVLPQRFLQRADRAAGDTLRVYFGGDGQPWRDGRVSQDPTGRRQLGLRLFLADPAADAYLGRPCYHVGGSAAPGCTPALWTAARYGPEVVDAMAAGLAQLRQQSGAGRTELVGYSGGGTLALLVAARETSVVRVVTVAPLLDPVAWTAHHRLAPLEGSLSPLDAPARGGLDEWHLLGGRDRVVPTRLAARYAAQRPGAQFRVYDDFDHRCCWLAHWPGLLDGLALPD